MSPLGLGGNNITHDFLLPKVNTAFKVSERMAVFLAGGLIALAAVAAYANSLACPFVFDDWPAIVDNPTIRHWWTALAPPASGAGVCGRPLLNFSFAINYAIGGTRVTGYHVLNLMLHIGAGLILFGAVRRTLLQPALRERFGAAALPVSAAIAALWLVHPLQTESVTCVVNRSEVLAGVLFLLTLYAFIRGTGGHASNGTGAGRHRAIWFTVAVVACLLGMASKEWMVSVPLLVLLYDRALVVGSLREAWHQRRGFYLALASTWILLAVLMIGSRQRNGVVGFGLGVSSWAYALTQCQAIVWYLGLSLWPGSLVFDYGEYLAGSVADVVPQGLTLGLLVAATLFALWRRPVLGLVGAWFFAILAPSSSVVPLVSQTMAEHRMYLPLVAVIGLGVTGLHRLLGRRSIVVFLALVVGFAWLTARRNEVYRDEITLWRDVIAKRPDNARAHNTLGLAWSQVPGRLPDAIAQYEEALRLRPGFARAHYNLGLTWSQMPGRLPDAIAQYQEALRLKPDLAEAHNNLGVAWSQVPGRLPDAIAQYEDALRLKPDYAEAHNNLGLAWAQMPGRLPDAIAQYEQALCLRPDDAETHNNLGVAFSQMRGRLKDAIAQFEETLRLKPDFARGWHNLGASWFQLGNRPAAATAFREELRLSPNDPAARQALEACRESPAGS